MNSAVETKMTPVLEYSVKLRQAFDGLAWPADNTEEYRRFPLSGLYPENPASNQTQVAFSLKSDGPLDESDISIFPQLESLQMSGVSYKAVLFPLVYSNSQKAVRALKGVSSAILQVSALDNGWAAPVVFIKAESGAETSIVIAMDAIQTEKFFPLIYLQAAEDARIKVTIVPRFGGKLKALVTEFAKIGKDASVEIYQGSKTGGEVRFENHLLLSGQASSAVSHGAFSVDKTSTTDFFVHQIHEAPNAYSRSLINSVVSGKGRANFTGLITVGEKAEKTDAYLTNRNLILTAGARVDSLPKLNIRTNDVKCSHGSTTGKIDPDQLFYLNCRGYNEEEAKRMLVEGFLSQAIDGADIKLFNNLIGVQE